MLIIFVVILALWSPDRYMAADFAYCFHVVMLALLYSTSMAAAILLSVSFLFVVFGVASGDENEVYASKSGLSP